MPATAAVVIQAGEEEMRRAGFGAGPIDATFNVISQIVSRAPDLEQFSINAITGGTDAQGEVTVRLREAIPKTTALSIELHSDPVADTDKSGLTLELVTGSFDRIYLDTADLPLATLQGELPADYDQTVRFVPLVKQAAASGSYLQTN